MYIGGADIEEEVPATGAAVTLEVVLRLDRLFSCWTAALRPRRVNGRLASPIS